jgi:hypothetical protein
MSRDNSDLFTESLLETEIETKRRGRKHARIGDRRRESETKTGRGASISLV